MTQMHLRSEALKITEELKSAIQDKFYHEHSVIWAGRKFESRLLYPLPIFDFPHAYAHLDQDFNPRTIEEIEETEDEKIIYWLKQSREEWDRSEFQYDRRQTWRRCIYMHQEELYRDYCAMTEDCYEWQVEIDIENLVPGMSNGFYRAEKMVIKLEPEINWSTIDEDLEILRNWQINGMEEEGER